MSLHSPPAVVEHWRHRVAALQAEIALLEQEGLISQGGDARALRRAAAAVQIDAANRELASHEHRWREELASVQAIRALRARAANDPRLSTYTAPPSELAALESELAALQQDAPLIFPQVDESVVAAVISDWTGIPVGRMVRDEVAAVFRLRATLDHRVIGQGAALDVIAQRVQTAKARLTDPNKPIGVFLLVGPSGVGKTETALALAEAMYGGEQNLITINMSEFQESHTVSTLKGAPPGYVGYGEGGVLTEAVRRKPYSVILLDEVEKAHPDVHEVFYQVFDKGWMEDGEGRAIDFRNTTILLTSNTGSDLIASLCDDPALVPGLSALRDALQPKLREVFPAAFLGRLSVVPYLPLPEAALTNIVILHLDRVVARMQEQHGIELHYTPALVTHIIDRCGTHETGARRLISFIEHQLLPVLSHHWLDALQHRRVIARLYADVAPRDAAGTAHAAAEVITCKADYVEPHSHFVRSQ
jgi:type VI secretion system protein VasG